MIGRLSQKRPEGTRAGIAGSVGGWGWLMAWLRVESSVARNRKFVQAGPGPSWLWICGLAYCQEGLTDGFIPSEIIDYLGVRHAGGMVKHLVATGLWEAVEGGWRVHDYLVHNRSASQVAELYKDRREAGTRGGIASGQSRKQNAKHIKPVCFADVEANTKQPSNPVQISTDQISTATDQISEGSPPMDVWFERLKGLYPPHRVTSGLRTMTAFVDALLRAREGPEPAFGRMLSNLALAKRGVDWADAQFVPKLENWLSSGAWEQVHEPAEAAPQPDDRGHLPPCRTMAECRDRALREAAAARTDP